MRRAFLLGLACAAAACVGEIGGDEAVVAGPGPDPLADCGKSVQPGPAPIRRMTRFEYDNTVRDLVGDTTHPAADFGAEEEALGFNNNAANLVTSSTLAEKYLLAAEGIAARATEPLSKVVACDPTAVRGGSRPTISEDECARQFITTFGKRAFRRPLTTDESDALFALYQVGRAEADFRLGVELVIQAALQAPAFLYRVELGLPDDAGEPVANAGGGPAIVRLDSWEMASRLSYFLWGTMPDEELFAAAEAGELVTREQVEAQARRMLDDPRARDAAGNFHVEWLDYDRIASVGKDAALFPEWSPALGQLMREETSAFVEHVVFDDEGDLASLLTAPYSYMNQELASFYGVSGPQGDAFEKVDLDPAQRAGVLTTGTLLTINAHSNQTSPVHRGKMIRELFLCDTMPPPPPGVVIKVPEPDPGSTARERFAQHSSDPACSGCHRLMDPIGFGFESYDAIARYRTTENGKTIDATGTLTESDIDGEFDGAVDLAHQLAASGDVQSCYVKQWFRYAYGRGETDEDVCTMARLDATFDESGGDIKELLVALTLTDAFLFRKAGDAP